MNERVVCRVCGRDYAARVPRGGDGSIVMPRSHDGPEGEPCDGMFEEGVSLSTLPACPWGWAGTPKRPACNYTGGHYCTRPAGHQGRCLCVCGASTTVTPETRQHDPCP